MKVDLQGNLLNRTAALENGNFTAAGKANICGLLMPNYSSGSDVTSAVFASTGTGYGPSTKKGVLFARCRNDAGSSTFYLYRNGTLVQQKLFNTSGYGSTSELIIIPLNIGDKLRIWQPVGTAGSDYYAVFYPYEGN